MTIQDQNSIIFEPIKLKADFNFTLPQGAKEIFIKGSDGIDLNAVYYPGHKDQPLMIYFPGNSKNLQNWLATNQQIADWNCGFLVADYRGFGKSGGEMNGEDEMYRDAEAIYDYAVKLGHQPQNIICYGYSMGTGMACHLAAVKEARALILESPYSSIAELHWVGDKAPSYKLENKEKAKSIKIPTLIIHGEKDDDIRPDHAHRLFDALNTAQKQLIIIPEGKHGDLRDKPVFLKAIRDFI